MASNYATKQLDYADQLVTYHSCDMSQKGPPSQTRTIEITRFQLVQVVGSVASLLHVFMRTCLTSSVGAEKHSLRNACAKHAKMQRM